MRIVVIGISVRKKARILDDPYVLITTELPPFVQATFNQSPISKNQKRYQIEVDHIT